MSTTRLTLKHDGDMVAPFFKPTKFNSYICLETLNEQFNPEIPRDTSRIYLCSAPVPLKSKADADFWLMPEFPFVETTGNTGRYLEQDIRSYLERRYEAGDRVAWIEYDA